MSNKPKAKAYHTAVSAYDEATVSSMVCEDYVQHNPRVPTGRDAFVSFLPKLREHETKIENIRMLADGPYVIMHHVWHNATPFGFPQSAAFHIIRFDGEGLIAEHWNVMAELSGTNPSGRTLVDGERTVTDIDATTTNRKRVRGWVDRLIEAAPVQMPRVMGAHCQPDYVQHNPVVADGVKGLSDAVDSGKLSLDYRRLHALFCEGNFALSIAEGLHNGVNSALYDLVRLADGKIAEHWSIYQEVPTENLANDNSMFGFIDSI